MIVGAALKSHSHRFSSHCDCRCQDSACTSLALAVTCATAVRGPMYFVPRVGLMLLHRCLRAPPALFSRGRNRPLRRHRCSSLCAQPVSPTAAFVRLANALRLKEHRHLFILWSISSLLRRARSLLGGKKLRVCGAPTQKGQLGARRVRLANEG